MEYREYEPDDPRPQVAVVGPHSSGTKAHHQLVIGLNATCGHPWKVFHISMPRPYFPVCDRYIWVQRDPTITMISQRHHGLGKTMDDVWQGIEDAAFVFRELHRPVLMLWYQDTVNDPRHTAIRISSFLGLPAIAPAFDPGIYDGDAKYRRLAEKVLEY